MDPFDSFAQAQISLSLGEHSSSKVSFIHARSPQLQKNMVKQVTTADEFTQAISSGIVIVDFTATWCAPCRMMAPIFEQLSTVYSKATFIKVCRRLIKKQVDVDQVPDVAQSAGIRAMPTFHIYVNGQRSVEIVGADKNKLEAAIKSVAA